MEDNPTPSQRIYAHMKSIACQSDKWVFLLSSRLYCFLVRFLSNTKTFLSNAHANTVKSEDTIVFLLLLFPGERKEGGREERSHGLAKNNLGFVLL